MDGIAVDFNFNLSPPPFFSLIVICLLISQTKKIERKELKSNSLSSILAKIFSEKLRFIFLKLFVGNNTFLMHLHQSMRLRFLKNVQTCSVVGWQYSC